MESKKWFIPKNYGWGLVPVTWQGWLTTLFYIGLMVAYVWYAYDLSHPELLTGRENVKMIFDVCLSAVAFMYLVSDKVEGKIGWYWGKTK